MQVTPEQQAELQEKMKNMSPAEIAALQKEYCLFCKIASKEVPAKTVYEDDTCIAFLDIHPATPGHLLLLPKQHCMILAQLPTQTNAHLAKVMKHLSQVLLRSLKVKGTTILVQNGEAAGQKAQHAMIHIIPRTEEDNLPLTPPRNELVADHELTQKLAKTLDELEHLPEPTAEQKEEASKEDQEEREQEEQGEQESQEEQGEQEFDEDDEQEQEFGEDDEQDEENTPELTTDFSDIISSLSGEDEQEQEETPMGDDTYEEEEGDDHEQEETDNSDEETDAGEETDADEDVEELSLDDTEEEGDDVEELDLDKLSEELHRGL